jgi:hypothetical protein
MLDLVKSFPGEPSCYIYCESYCIVYGPDFVVVVFRLGPLTPSSKQADVMAFMDRFSRQQSLRESLSSVYVDPSASSGDAAGGAAKSSEHLLWAVLRILVENNGSVSHGANNLTRLIVKVTNCSVVYHRFKVRMA